ncbi:telomere length regulation protein [Nemania sp. FL0031]|nr:telomere length regulation protein [Nemania sp. FL0031]
MGEFLVPVSQTYRKGSEPDQFLSLATAAEPAKVAQATFRGTSPEEALQALKNQPDHDTLLAVLEYLQNGGKGEHKFDVRTPGPLSAQIIHALITEIVPNYWTVLQESSNRSPVRALLACLRSLPGINATLTYIRSLIREAKSKPKDSNNAHVIFNLTYTLSLLASILDGDGQVMRIWGYIASKNDPAHTRPLRQELLSLFTSGKIVSLSAEAEDVCRQAGQLTEPIWVADNKQYINWLARNQIQWVTSQPGEEDIKLCAELGARAMRLGHAELLVQELLYRLLLQNDADKDIFSKLVNSYPALEQRKVLFLILKLLSDLYLASIDDNEADKDYPAIWASVSILKAVVANNDAQRSNLVTWLTSASGAGVGEGCSIRRAAVATLADDKDSISTVLERSLNLFSDKLYIKHTPVLQQEAHAQVLLLSAGYVHRVAPMKLAILLRSSTYLNAISNRLDVSQSRARFLGMAVGEALSGLVHGKDTKLDFKVDEMATEEADWYKSLVHISDKAGPLDPLRTSIPSSQTNASEKPKPVKSAKLAKPASKQKPPQPSKAPAKTGFIIEEIVDDEEQEDPDLTPYAKPDSDAEDSDDDPTLINRDKPKAPVYIRDLIAYFRDTESYDKQKLALTTAPTLIRRKANYGTEVVSHAVDLASLLVGLQDKFDFENFYDLRLQGMVAVVVAQPKKMAPWFAKTFFDGDYSLSQRASILVVLGLSGREIAGFETSEYASAAHFPSKTLPDSVSKRYLQPSSAASRLQAGANLKALPPNALDNLAQSLSQTFLAPMAAEAADAATGPDALKLSSFTSRLQQSQASSSGSSGTTKYKYKSKSRGVRSIPNTTAALISSHFFFPLSSRFQAAMRSAVAAKIIFQPHLLALYLKTLGLLIHAAGPSTLALPQMTAELWDLVLGVRGRCLTPNTNAANGGGDGDGDMAMTHAVLLALAALLEVNEGDVRGLCERQGRQVVETMEWVSNVFENTRGGERAGEENDVKMLAAGILIRLREAVDKYQAVLMGDLIGFT